MKTLTDKYNEYVYAHDALLMAIEYGDEQTIKLAQERVEKLEKEFKEE